MKQLKAFRGVIRSIDPLSSGSGCDLIFTIIGFTGADEIFRLVVTPDTFVLDNTTLQPGDEITAWIDASRPVILIYPPQYEAVAIAKATHGENVKADLFNSELISSDGMLQLNLSPETKIIQTNGQIYPGTLANNSLLVIYGPSTRSIPAQTTPYEVIVLCDRT